MRWRPKQFVSGYPGHSGQPTSLGSTSVPVDAVPQSLGRVAATHFRRSKGLSPCFFSRAGHCHPAICWQQIAMRWNTATFPTPVLRRSPGLAPGDHGAQSR
jgi:hypothetical protein